MHLGPQPSPAVMAGICRHHPSGLAGVGNSRRPSFISSKRPTPHRLTKVQLAARTFEAIPSVKRSTMNRFSKTFQPVWIPPNHRPPQTQGPRPRFWKLSAAELGACEPQNTLRLTRRVRACSAFSSSSKPTSSLCVAYHAPKEWSGGGAPSVPLSFTRKKGGERTV